MRADGGTGFDQMRVDQIQSPAQRRQQPLAVFAGVAVTDDRAQTGVFAQCFPSALRDICGERFRRFRFREQAAGDTEFAVRVHPGDRREPGEAHRGLGPCGNAAAAHGVGDVAGHRPGEGERAINEPVPMLQRYLPFWLANLIERMWLVLGILLAALLPLREGPIDSATPAFGLLVLGSPDPQRFDATMGTEFLTRLAELASAALMRLR